MKKQIKQIVGKMLSTVCVNPVGRACLNQSGYSCIPSYQMEVIKNLDKHEDITKYETFGEIATGVINDRTTCLYYDRLYTIYQTLLSFDKTHLNTIEIGVYKGGTSKFILETLKRINIIYNHYCIDTFEGHSEKDIGSNDTHKVNQFNDTSLESVTKLLASYNEDNLYGNLSIKKGRFEEFKTDLNDKDFDFVYLDMDLYSPTLDALKFFSSILKSKSIILIDDYGHKSCPGIRKAVDEFLKTDDTFFNFHLLTGQMLLVKYE